MTLDDLTSRLSRILSGRPEVRVAFLFGSSVTRGSDQARDVDVAVTFSSPVRLLEQTDLAGRLEEAVGRDVDLVDLDTASTVLRWEVARVGIPLWAADPADIVAFRARAPLEYFDLQPFLERESAGLRRALEKSRWSSSRS